MSYTTWHNYGFGIDFTEFEAKCKKAGISISVEDIERLLTHAPKLASEVHEFLDDLREGDECYTLSIDDYEDFDDNYCLGLSHLFAETIREAEDLQHVFACDDYDCNHYVIFAQACPWTYTERERSLTKDELEDIFLNYLLILKPEYPDEFAVIVDYQSVENGG